jgi:hypothetical protein
MCPNRLAAIGALIILTSRITGEPYRRRICSARMAGPWSACGSIGSSFALDDGTWYGPPLKIYQEYQPDTRILFEKDQIC